MLRSLAAVIAAVIAGLGAAKIVESFGAALTGAAPASPAYGGLLIVGWGVGAFVAALTALLIGKRWAPIGALAAAAIFLAAMITLFSFPVPWFAWPGALLATALGGFGAVRITGAKAQHPDLQRKDGLFDE